MWKEVYPTMQNWTGCASLGTEQTVTLKDIRDNNLYTVAKLKDGKCWMTQNLRLQNYTLKSTDSNVSNNFNLPASNLSNFQGDVFGRVAVYYDNVYGGYYTWPAAVANINTGANPIAGHDEPYSICPKSWRLPTYLERNSLLNLYSDAAQLANKPVNFQLGGNISRTGELTAVGSGYWYWTSTAYDGTSSGNGYMHCAYPLAYGGIHDGTDDCGRTTVGGSIRCIAQK